VMCYEGRGVAMARANPPWLRALHVLALVVRCDAIVLVLMPRACNNGAMVGVVTATMYQYNALILVIVLSLIELANSVFNQLSCIVYA
jgi:hypothetical protein